jgi:hypothetical protein
MRYFHVQLLVATRLTRRLKRRTENKGSRRLVREGKNVPPPRITTS